MAEVYVVYGFRWNRGPSAKAFGIRAYVTYHDILDAASEYLQEPLTNRCVLESFEKVDPDILKILPDLQLIEQYDPDDTSPAAVSQPYAYVAAKTMMMGDRGKKGGGLSLSLEEIMEKGPGLTQRAREAFDKLRETLAPESKMGWFIVYNGDPERAIEDDGGDDNGCENDEAMNEFSIASIRTRSRELNKVRSLPVSVRSSYNLSLGRRTNDIQHMRESTSGSTSRKWKSFWGRK
ncbi:hypothetical protein KEM56_001381 [Ascosphaera pollenicola]|nr:hypothetical protein KEM56_001381 [Ascosphaera pollenicola]